MKVRFLEVEKEAYFPNLNRANYEVTSEETSDYNCIAHAAGKNNKWWWPAEAPAYWPAEVEKIETLEGFVAAYATLGYTMCPTQGRDLVIGVEKVAVYVDSDGIPTHAARQLPDGFWTSKLGEWEDIRHHTLEAMEDAGGLGLGYGKVAVILRRTIK